MKQELTSIEKKVYNNVKNLINANNRKGKDTIIAQNFLTILAKGNEVTEDEFKNALVRLSELGLIIPEKPGKILTLYTLPNEDINKEKKPLSFFQELTKDLEPEYAVPSMENTIDFDSVYNEDEEYKPKHTYSHYKTDGYVDKTIDIIQSLIKRNVNTLNGKSVYIFDESTLDSINREFNNIREHLQNYERKIN